MDKYYYIDREGKQKGPVDVDQLKKLGLPPYTLIWKNGMREWSEFSTLMTFDSKNATHKTAQDKKQPSRSSTTTPSATTSNQTNAAAISPKEKSQSETITPTSKPHTSSEIRQDKYRKWAIIQLVLIPAFYLPCTFLFQYLTKEFADTEELSYVPFSNLPSLFINVALFATRHWPLIALAFAGYFALSSYCGWGDLVSDEKNCLYISIAISILTLILGILMIFNPGLACGIVFILSTIAIAIAYNYNINKTS